MDLPDIDKLVVATLAAALATAAKKETPGQYIAEYEKMLRVFERRKAKRLEAKDDDSAEGHAT